MRKLVECVPNFSEGRDSGIINQIAAMFSGKSNVKLLDYSSDIDHNRSVFTLIGEPEAVNDVMFEATRFALSSIDLNTHSGVHPRIGAVDVIPFIPLCDMTMAEAAAIARRLGERIGCELEVPVYLYGAAALDPERENLAKIRQGQFEGLQEKMKSKKWYPDFGPYHPHRTFGAVAIGARFFLLAYNIELDTNDLEIAKRIARDIRTSSGGMPEVKAMGVPLKNKGTVQVSMNLTDYRITSLRRIFDRVSELASEMGVMVKRSEFIGMPPLAAFKDCSIDYLRLEGFKEKRILDNYIKDFIDNNY